MTTEELDRLLREVPRDVAYAEAQVRAHLEVQNAAGADRWLEAGWALHRVRVLAQAARWERPW